MAGWSLQTAGGSSEARWCQMDSLSCLVVGRLVSLEWLQLGQHVSAPCGVLPSSQASLAFFTGRLQDFKDIEVQILASESSVSLSLGRVY